MNAKRLLKAFINAAPDLCEAIDDCLAAGKSNDEISRAIDQAVPDKNIGSQAAHLYLKSKINTRNSTTPR